MDRSGGEGKNVSWSPKCLMPWMAKEMSGSLVKNKREGKDVKEGNPGVFPEGWRGGEGVEGGFSHYVYHSMHRRIL